MKEPFVVPFYRTKTIEVLKKIMAYLITAFFLTYVHNKVFDLSMPYFLDDQ
jgi:hypothetical protein